MKKETLAEKIARAAYESDKFQKSWAVHQQVFGPILEPAFVGNYQVRVHLADALNKISRGDIKGGLEKLSPLQQSCETDEDKAAWLYFMGLCFERAGAVEPMLEYYQEAGHYAHRFYLPYLRVAKQAHNDRVFEAAEKNYRRAIGCFDGAAMDGQSRMALASAYTNLGSCLTMMHRYEEAAEAFEMSEKILEKQPGRSAGLAVLCAVQGDRSSVEVLLEETAREAPQMLEETKKLTTEILDGKHPHFYSVEIDQAAVETFCQWFVQNQESLRRMLSEENYDEMFEMLQAAIVPMVPFLQRSPELGIEPEADSCKIIFADFFVVSLREAYERVIQNMPAELGEFWHFEIRH